MGELIQESLELYGIKSREDAAAVLQRARRGAGLSAEEALAIGVAESRAHRQS